MTRFLTRKNAIALAVMAAICMLAIGAAPESEEGVQPLPWYSILPPLLAVTLAIVTGRILESLALAVLAGGLLSAVPQSPLSPLAWIHGLGNGLTFVWVSVSDSTNLQILAFVTLVLAMVAVVIVAGGLHAVVLALGRYVHGRTSAQFATACMGLLVFIDDYANTMIVGASMRPLTDRHRVSREKLSFLVDATSAPIAGLAIVSTWVGYEVGLFADAAESLGIQSTGYAMLFDALPFRFYCIFMIAFVFANILSRKDFGPMARAEIRAEETGALAEEDAVPMTSKAFSAAEPDKEAKVRLVTAIVPIGGLFVFLLAGIWRDGGGMAKLDQSFLSIFNPYDWRDVIGASENSIALLAYSAAFGLTLAVLFARFVGAIKAKVIGRALGSGAWSSALPILILLLAWSLKEACTALGTGPFLVATVGESVSPAFFPAITFVIAALTSFATGTSYGTMAILMPTAVPIAFHLEGGIYGPVTIVTLAAILDGSIVGDHCSPISDTTIMSSIASSADHLHHVRTQLPYSMTVAALALGCGYIPAGLGLPPWLGLAAGLAVMIVLFALLPHNLSQAKAPTQK